MVFGCRETITYGSLNPLASRPGKSDARITVKTKYGMDTLIYLCYLLASYLPSTSIDRLYHQIVTMLQKIVHTSIKSYGE